MLYLMGNIGPLMWWIVSETPVNTERLLSTGTISRTLPSGRNILSTTMLFVMQRAAIPAGQKLLWQLVKTLPSKFIPLMLVLIWISRIGPGSVMCAIIPVPFIMLSMMVLTGVTNG